MRRKALFMVLSAKAKENLIVLLNSLKLDKPKTKLIIEILNNLPIKRASCLIALPKKEEAIIRASKNIPKVETIQAKDLNTLDLLSFKYLLRKLITLMMQMLLQFKTQNIKL